MLPTLITYIETLLSEIDSIDSDRKESLKLISSFIQEKKGSPAKLIFICTHNSRRSHFGQVWAKVMAEYFKVPNVETYSGGTEATAFNISAIQAIEETGLQVSSDSRVGNPRYKVLFDKEQPALTAFSKVFSHSENPQSDFCAVMTCTHADESCPFIPGAFLRVATPYEDPKLFDGTPRQKEMYAARCKQIAIEMAYVMQKVFSK